MASLTLQLVMLWKTIVVNVSDILVADATKTITKAKRLIVNGTKTFWINKINFLPCDGNTKCSSPEFILRFSISFVHGFFHQADHQIKFPGNS